MRSALSAAPLPRRRCSCLTVSAPVPARQPPPARPVDPLTMQQKQRGHVLVTVSSSPAGAARPCTPTWPGTCCPRRRGSRWRHGLSGTRPATQQTGLRAAYLQGQGQGQNWQATGAPVAAEFTLVPEELIARERVRGNRTTLHTLAVGLRSKLLENYSQQLPRSPTCAVIWFCSLMISQHHTCQPCKSETASTPTVTLPGP